MTAQFFGDTRRRLPTEAYDLAIRLGATPGLERTRVHLTQVGRMRQDAASKWMAFRADQTIATRTCAFDWHARSGPAGLVRIRDSLAGAEGHLRVTVLGVPIARMPASVALTRGQLMRYLAEIPWAPDAILLNRALDWRVLGADRLVVGAGPAEARVEVELTLDREGRVSEAYAPDRPRAVHGGTRPTPWRGRFSNYGLHDGMLLPFQGAVEWIVDGVEEVAWEGRLGNWHALTA